MQHLISLAKAAEFGLFIQDTSYARYVFERMAAHLDMPIQSNCIPASKASARELEIQLMQMSYACVLSEAVSTCISLARKEKATEIALALAKKNPRKSAQYKKMHETFSVAGTQEVNASGEGYIDFIDLGGFYEAFLFGARCHPGILYDEDGDSNIPMINEGFAMVGLPLMPQLMRNEKLDRQILAKAYEDFVDRDEGVVPPAAAQVEIQDVAQAAPRLRLVSRDIG